MPAMSTLGLGLTVSYPIAIGLRFPINGGIFLFSAIRKTGPGAHPVGAGARFPMERGLDCSWGVPNLLPNRRSPPLTNPGVE
jgi:hypothetical protein